MNSENTALGFHGLWDAHDCDPNCISYLADVKPAMNAIAQKLNLTILGESFKQFEPHGVTGIFLLSESHLSIHTWPERNYVAVDIFSCKPFEQELVAKILAEYFQTENIQQRLVRRGVTDPVSVGA